MLQTVHRTKGFTNSLTSLLEYLNVGQSGNIDKRLKQHNKGRYTCVVKKAATIMIWDINNEFI